MLQQIELVCLIYLNVTQRKGPINPVKEQPENVWYLRLKVTTIIKIVYLSHSTDRLSNQ